MTGWLVTGVTGLLGSNAALDLSADGRVVGAARRLPASSPVELIDVDLADAASRAGLVARSGADAVFHSAAISTIEDSERDPSLARVVNVEASADLAAQAADAGAAFVYISTDAVFDGRRGGYSEDDEPAPQSVYGRTKLDGERAVLDAHPGALVARANFYGWSPSGRRSLAEFFYGALSSGETVHGFDDQTVSTLHVASLIASLRELVARGASGVVHVASPEPTTKYDFGRRLAGTFGFDPESVLRGRSSDHLDLPRGSRLDLDTAKMEGLIGHAADGQQAGLDALLHAREAGRPEALRAFR